MKTTNSLYVFLLLTSLFFLFPTKTEAKNPPTWKYDIECAGLGADGSYLVKVWTYGKDKNVETNLVKQNAVHGVLFRGFPAGDQGCKAQRPIIKAPAVYDEKINFFNTFFGKEAENGAEYTKYASIVSPAPEVIKVNKKEYKVGYVVSVAKDMLRKDMESAGIIKSLSSGF